MMVTVAFANGTGSATNALSYALTTSGGLDPATGWAAGDWAGWGAWGAWPQPSGMPFSLADDSVADISGGGAGSPFATDAQGIVDSSFSADDEVFGVTDTVNGANATGGITATWTFDIAGYTDLNFAVDLAAMGDFEVSDRFTFSYAIDGGPATDLLVVSADEAASQTYTMEGGRVVVLDDPLVVNGTVLDDTLKTLTAALAGTGSVLELTFSANTDGGSEGFVFDNIEIEGVAFDRAPVINEFVFNHTGTDVSEYIEVFAAPGADLSALSLLVIEGDSGSTTGVVDDVFTLDTADAAGFWTTGFRSNDLENGTQTVLLVEGFTGSAGDDLDTDDDGVLDVTPWDAIADSVAVSDGGADDLAYADTALAPGYDGVGFTPGGASRIPNGADTDSPADWMRNDFDLAGLPGETGTPQIGEAFNTPGAVNAAVDSEPPAQVNVHDIQGVSDFISGEATVGIDDVSPLLGETVSVSGIVTASFLGTNSLGGFYIQEDEPDADERTSEGLFIIAPFASVTVGDLVEVTGLVTEIEGETRLTGDEIAVLDTGLALPDAVALSFPTAGVMLDGDGDYVADLESYEGMRVTIEEAMSVTELFQLDRFGTIRVSSEGRLEQFTQSNAPSVDGYTQHRKDVAARSLLIDDGSEVQNPNPILLPDGNDGVLTAADTFRMGDTLSNLTGVLSFSEDDQSSSEEPEFRIHLPQAEYTPVNERLDTPEEVGGRLTVASFNVLNFFTTLDTFPGNEGVGPNGLEPRGADTNPQNAVPGVGELDEFNRQVEKLIGALEAIDADVVGLVELENDFLAGGTSPDVPEAQGDRGPAIAYLVDALNERLGEERYAWVDPGQEFVGGDAIATGLIYDTTTVQLAGGTKVATLTDTDLPGLGLDFGNPVFDGEGTSRSPIAATFEEIGTGEVFTVAVNHFKSKGSVSPFGDNADIGDGQGNNNEARLQAATAVKTWLDSDPTGSGDSDVLIVGDLNSYQEEDPITYLEGEGYVDLAELYQPDGYSYVFDGQLGALDYIMASDSLAGQSTGATEWHVNADEADAFDYNLEFGRDPALFDGTEPFRNSDHDPLIVGLNLGEPEFVLVEGGPRYDRLVGTEANEIFRGNGGTDAITTGGGIDIVDLYPNTVNGKRDVTFVTDFDVATDMLGGITADNVLESFGLPGRTTLLLDSKDIVTLIGVTDPDDIVYDDSFMVA